MVLSNGSRCCGCLYWYCLHCVDFSASCINVKHLSQLICARVALLEWANDKLQLAHFQDGGITHTSEKTPFVIGSADEVEDGSCESRHVAVGQQLVINYNIWHLISCMSKAVVNVCVCMISSRLDVWTLTRPSVAHLSILVECLFPINGRECSTHTPCQHIPPRTPC